MAGYDSAGALLWAAGAGGSSDDFVVGLASDAAGNCYAAGWSFSTNFTAGGLSLTNELCGQEQGSPEGELFILKYRADGTILWGKGVPMNAGGIPRRRCRGSLGKRPCGVGFLHRLRNQHR